MMDRALGIFIWAWVALVASLLALTSPATADIVGPAKVIDGDTLEIKDERIRLHGIDAPELDQPCETESGDVHACGRIAKHVLRALIAKQEVTCKGDSHDRYGRLIAVCYVGRTDLNEQMVDQGWALAYRKYSLDYVKAEETARRSREGLWRRKLMPPWEWRKSKTDARGN